MPKQQTFSQGFKDMTKIIHKKVMIMAATYMALLVPVQRVCVSHFRCNVLEEWIFSLWKDSGSELCDAVVLHSLSLWCLFLGHANIRCPFSFLRAQRCMHGEADYFYLIIINVSNRNLSLWKVPSGCRGKLLHRFAPLLLRLQPHSASNVCSWFPPRCFVSASA